MAFENASGGFELRNKFFKGSNSPKSLTLINGNDTGQNQVCVYEGFMDFLSHLTLEKKDTPDGDAIILNSLSFQQQTIRVIFDKGYTNVSTYLDNNPAGEKATRAFKETLESLKVTPMNHLYQGHDDLNEYLVAKQREGPQGTQFGR